VRARLESERNAAPGKETDGNAVRANLDPVAHWNFETGTTDLISGIDLTLKGTAHLEKGGLVLDGNGFAASSPLPFDLAEKTLEVIVELATLDQAGGGVITVQDRRGGTFDSLVFAERSPKQWLAGSDNHVRTLDFDCPDDTSAANEAIHLVLTYAKDGAIRCFRNGAPWGEAIRKSDPESFQRGQSNVLFGLRHGTSTQGNRTLKGTVLDARLYDRELSENEVRSAYKGGPVTVTGKEIDEALSEVHRAELYRLDSEISALEAERTELQELGADTAVEERRWQDLSHAIFNLKEFIYLR
jgi:hypothetical protein